MIGGRSPWGSFLDNVCERYGWTVEYAVWGVSYLNVMMMLSDAVTYIPDYKGSKKYNQPKIPDAKKTMYKGNFNGFMNFMHQLKKQ